MTWILKCYGCSDEQCPWDGRTDIICMKDKEDDTEEDE